MPAQRTKLATTMERTLTEIGHFFLERLALAVFATWVPFRQEPAVMLIPVQSPRGRYSARDCQGLEDLFLMIKKRLTFAIVPGS